MPQSNKASLQSLKLVLIGSLLIFNYSSLNSIESKKYRIAVSVLVCYMRVKRPHLARTHLFCLKKPLSELLSLTVTVNKFTVTSVTVTVSRLEKWGVQDGSASAPAPVARPKAPGWHSLRCVCRPPLCLGCLSWGSDPALSVLCAPSRFLTSGLITQL